jgi:hypothetical protein
MQPRHTAPEDPLRPVDMENLRVSRQRAVKGEFADPRATEAGHWLMGQPCIGIIGAATQARTRNDIERRQWCSETVGRNRRDYNRALLGHWSGP